MIQEHHANPKTSDQAQGAVGRVEEENNTFSERPILNFETKA
jgi:hypothetical protein